MQLCNETLVRLLVGTLYMRANAGIDRVLAVSYKLNRPRLFAPCVPWFSQQNMIQKNEAEKIGIQLS